jgi:hypothetical protein
MRRGEPQKGKKTPKEKSDGEDMYESDKTRMRKMGIIN